MGLKDRPEQHGCSGFYFLGGTGLNAKLILDPFMIHELFPFLTESAFGSHPRRVVSVSYRKLRPFHGANAGSNPAGDAKSMPCKRTIYSLFNKMIVKSWVWSA